MSRSVNKVMLLGNLTRDPELRYTPQGHAVCTFGLATNREWVTNGERQEAAEFHNIVSWHKLAELCSQLLHKGSKSYVEGRLQTRTWDGEDGRKHYKTEVVIDEMIVLGGRRPPSPEAEYSQDKEESVEEVSEETTEKEGGEDVSSDDIPF